MLPPILFRELASIPDDAYRRISGLSWGATLISCCPSMGWELLVEPAGSRMILVSERLTTTPDCVTSFGGGSLIYVEFSR
jgi:hypothetical protein